jgi:hypothetical protein
MKAFYTLLIILIPLVGLCQQTFIPDDNFEQALIDLGLDNILDDSVITANIEEVSLLDINCLMIFDITGIEDFTNLEILNISNNFLDNVDLSQNINLTELDISSNGIESINLDNNVNLISIDFSSNNLQTVNFDTNLNLVEH